MLLIGPCGILSKDPLMFTFHNCDIIIVISAHNIAVVLTRHVLTVFGQKKRAVSFQDSIPTPFFLLSAVIFDSCSHNHMTDGPFLDSIITFQASDL